MTRGLGLGVGVGGGVGNLWRREEECAARHSAVNCCRWRWSARTSKKGSISVEQAVLRARNRQSGHDRTSDEVRGPHAQRGRERGGGGLVISVERFMSRR